MKITGVCWKGFSIPFNNPYVTAKDFATHKYGTLLFLQSDSGITGVGEVSPVGAGNFRELKTIQRDLWKIARRILKEENACMDVINSVICEEASSFTRPLIEFGLETAIMDIYGKLEGKPMWELLGANSPIVPVNALITAETPEKAINQSSLALESGFSSLKLKVGFGEGDRDIEMVAAVRDVIGPEPKLRIDVNGNWSVSKAIEKIGTLESVKLEYVEQPVESGDFLGLEMVCRAVSVPLGVDESITDVTVIDWILRTQTVGIFIIKMGRLGGIGKSIEGIKSISAANKVAVVTSSLESGVGLAASCHIATIIEHNLFALGLATNSLLESDLLCESLSIRAGHMILTGKPGLGIEIDFDALAWYAVGISGSIGWK